MNSLLSLLPVLAYLLALKALDSFSLARWKMLLACLGYGIACCLVLFFFSFGDFTPVAEEIFKGGLAVFLILKKRIRFLPESLIYGGTVGAGFALLENIIYLYYQPEMMVGTAVVRGFGCAILHMGCTALVAAIFLLLISSRIPNPLGALLSFIPSTLIHISYNLAQQHDLANPMVLMVVIVFVFICLFIILFSYGEKRIYKWMDHSISIDVQTLSAIRTGNFSSTKAGKYLLDVREQFKPDCFFDMICYIQLHLELKIEKQSYMLLCETGFSGEDMGETLEEHLAKKSELAALKRRIGTTGMRVLSPLVSERESY